MEVDSVKGTPSPRQNPKPPTKFCARLLAFRFTERLACISHCAKRASKRSLGVTHLIKGGPETGACSTPFYREARLVLGPARTGPEPPRFPSAAWR